MYTSDISTSPIKKQISPRSTLSSLPIGLNQEVSSYLSDRDILNLSLTSKENKDKFIGNEAIWRERLIRESATTPLKTDFKQTYKNVTSESHYLGNVFKLNEPYKSQLKNIKVIKAASGESHTILIDENHDVWLVAKGTHDNIIDNFTKIFFRAQPHSSTFLYKFDNFKAKDVSCGKYHSIFIDDNDNVCVFGLNVNGQLGFVKNNIVIQQPKPLLINGNVVKAKVVSCGYLYSMIIDNNDYVWGFGDNIYGQLGNGMGFWRQSITV